jgi:hypothetical protein
MSMEDQLVLLICVWATHDHGLPMTNATRNDSKRLMDSICTCLIWDTESTACCPLMGVQINVSQVVETLSRELGRPPRLPTLRHQYEWMEALYASNVSGAIQLQG